MRDLIKSFLLAGAGAACLSAAAQAPVAAAATSASAAPLRRDPGMPSLAVRQAAQAERRAQARSQAAAPSLNARVEQQLRGSFDAADRAHRGTLTRAQAQAGGFGFVAQHFDAIDAHHAGEVSFDDVKRFLQARGARYVDR